MFESLPQCPRGNSFNLEATRVREGSQSSSISNNDDVHSSYVLTTPAMEDLCVSLQSARHSFLQTVTGCFDSSSLMTVLTHSATPSTFPHSMHLPFVQGAESFLRLQVFKELISISLMDFRLTTSTSFNQGSLKNITCLPKGKKILEEKWISLKSSFLEGRIGSQKLMFLIQMALSGCQLTEWNKHSSAKEVMHRTQRDMFTCKALAHSHWLAPVHQQRRAQRSSVFMFILIIFHLSICV
ncbi:unnamed protein product [Brassica rapa subsp. narinosa]